MLSRKSFPLWGGDFLELFVKIHYSIYSIFTAQGVLKNGQWHEMGLKLKYMISIIIAAIPKNVFLYGVEPFVSLLSWIHTYPYSKCIFTIQGVPKMKNAKKWAKVEINDFNQYNCSPERVAFMRWSFLGAFCLKYLDILFQSVFSLMPLN